MRRVSMILGVSAAALMTLPAGAGAATTVGSNLAGTATNDSSPNVSSAPRAQPPGVALPLTAPSAGVITQILIKHGGSGANPGVYGLRVLSGSGAMYSTTGAPVELPDFAWPANDPAGTRPFLPSLGGVPKGIPIAAGNRLGIVRVGGMANQGAMFRSNSSMGELDQVLGVHNSGMLFYDTQVPNELLIQYLIEPDADGDGFGDETQDGCPTNASVRTACPVTPATAPAKKKCKKRKRRAADAAKKKRCKKRKKKR